MKKDDDLVLICQCGYNLHIDRNTPLDLIEIQKTNCLNCDNGKWIKIYMSPMNINDIPTSYTFS